MGKYTLIEYTPGYMPDSDDPPIFDTKFEARTALIRRWEELNEDKDYLGMPEGGVDRWRVSNIADEDDWFIYYDNEKEAKYDLGRMVEVTEVEEE